MPPILAGGAVSQVPVLRGRPDGRVQHAPVHPEGVQSDRRQGKSEFPDNLIVQRTAESAGCSELSRYFLTWYFGAGSTFPSNQSWAPSVKRYSLCNGNKRAARGAPPADFVGSWCRLPPQYHLSDATRQESHLRGIRILAGRVQQDNVDALDPRPRGRLSSPPAAFCFQDGQSRTVRQFQFTDWPEQGVPKSGEGFIDFIGQVHKTKEQFGQDGPISVHCR